MKLLTNEVVGATERKNTLSNETDSKAVNFFVPRTESVPCSGCFSLICICASTASLSPHQANANLSFLKRASPRPPEYVDRFRSENLLIYTFLILIAVQSYRAYPYDRRAAQAARKLVWRPV
jgi:hypothetical protein